MNAIQRQLNLSCGFEQYVCLKITNVLDYDELYYSWKSKKIKRKLW
jgi:hypothetical protein